MGVNKTVTSMLSPHLRKFSDLYAAHGLGVVKNIWLITCLIPLARTANLKTAGKNKLPLALFATAYSLAIRKGWKRRDLTPLNRYKDGSHCREVSIFRDGFAILTTKCRDFLNFPG